MAEIKDVHRDKCDVLFFCLCLCNIFFYPVILFFSVWNIFFWMFLFKQGI